LAAAFSLQQVVNMLHCTLSLVTIQLLYARIRKTGPKVDHKKVVRLKLLFTDLTLRGDLVTEKRNVPHHFYGL